MDMDVLCADCTALPLTGRTDPLLARTLLTSVATLYSLFASCPPPETLLVPEEWVEGHEKGALPLPELRPLSSPKPKGE